MRLSSLRQCGSIVVTRGCNLGTGAVAFLGGRGRGSGGRRRRRANARAEDRERTCSDLSADADRGERLARDTGDARRRYDGALALDELGNELRVFRRRPRVGLVGDGCRSGATFRRCLVHAAGLCPPLWTPVRDATSRRPTVAAQVVVVEH